jgi:uncharacterized protein (DUF1810 family)
MSDASDPFDLQRFVDAQATVWSDVCAELRAGEKRTHWMWFVFPQVAGLGRSGMAQFYALQDAVQARAYHAHPLLGARLRECFQWVLAARRPIEDIFPAPDDMKFRSCAALFASAVPEESLYQRVISECCGGQRDALTLQRLGAQRGP